MLSNGPSTFVMWVFLSSRSAAVVTFPELQTLFRNSPECGTKLLRLPSGSSRCAEPEAEWKLRPSLMVRALHDCPDLE